MLKIQGQPQHAQEPQKRRLGPGSRALARTCPSHWALALAASFVVPEHAEAVPGSALTLQHMNYVSQAANL